MSQFKKDDDEENEKDPADDDGDHRMQIGLGLSEYFIAKRAVKKMIDFYKRKKEERKRLEADAERARNLKEQEE
jgi:hypothetical protein